MPQRAARLRLRTLVRTVAPLLLIVLLGGCLLPPEPHTSAAKDVWNLYAIVFAMGAMVFVGVEGFIIYAIFRYRRRDDRLPEQTHGNNLIEVVWTAIPTVIVLILFVLSVMTLGTVNATTQPGVEIEVDGFQWQWTFNYLDETGQTEYSVTGTPGNPPVMAVPINEPVKLRLVTLDVIHSFYVPSFLIKRDLIPVQNPEDANTLEFTVTEAGTYAGQCAEFCGDLHAQMLFSVQGMTRDDYNAWLDAAKRGETPKPSVAPGATVLDLNASQIAFDTQQLTAPANENFTIHFTSADTVPHNVAIFNGDQRVFTGDAITGPNAAADYVVSGLAPGEYTFICDFHANVPDMQGTLTVE